MGFLLDTHAFLWFATGDKKLPSSIREKITDINQSCFISIASFWEITIKIQIKKLQINISLNQLYLFDDRNNIKILQINEQHLTDLLTLEFIHNDPFDRLIISQAISEKLILITKDKGLKKYKVKQQWT
jgi:PIN domain nuclease of toxin-antitoxin system